MLLQNIYFMFSFCVALVIYLPYLIYIHIKKISETFIFKRLQKDQEICNKLTTFYIIPRSVLKTYFYYLKTSLLHLKTCLNRFNKLLLQ